MGFRGTFLGLSLRSYDSSIGWGIGQPSRLTVQLVQDNLNGDTVPNAQALLGTPVYFQHGAFKFNGLLQRFDEKKDRGGFPVYETIIVDPREIIEGTQLIIGGYSGSTSTVANLLNPFGWWEDPTNSGYGGSQSTDAGMPWLNIYNAILSMTNSPAQGPYGGPLQFRGVSYGLDLSQLPTPPLFYRIGGNYIGLMEAIAQICEDGGCDFFIELQGLTIVVRTVSRAVQPPLGTLTALAQQGFGNNTPRTSAGMEIRNEVTSSFLVGGDVQILNLTNTLTSFWGYDTSGNPITPKSNVFIWQPEWQPSPQFLQPTTTPTIPKPSYLLNATQPPGVLPTGSTATHIVGGSWQYVQASTQSFESMNLNSSPIADITQGLIYECTTLELRCAKANFETWAAFMSMYRSAVVKAVGINAPNANMGAPNMIPLANNFVNDAQAAAECASAVRSDTVVRMMRLFEFVRAYAEEYMGRKYLANVPFVLRKQDSETLKISTSYDVSSGGYLPEGSAPLGLSTLNEDRFMLQDGRFRAFVSFNNVRGADLQAVSPQNTVIENNTLFMQVSVDENIVFLPTPTNLSPTVLVTMSSAVTDEAIDTVGDSKILAGVLQNDSATAVQNAFQQGYVPLRVAPAVRAPNAAAIPLRSNVLTYGPWSVAGPPGKVKFEQDTGLTPWNYGGFDVMDQAGQCRVIQAVTNQQIAEAGTIEQVGLPQISLGDVLQAGGPNLTNITVQIDASQVTTSYRFETFSPRFGVGAKSQMERLKRMSLATQELRRTMRASFRDDVQNAETLQKAATSAFLANAPPAFRRESPGSVLVSSTQLDTVNGDVRSDTQVSTFAEAITLSNANDNTLYQQTGLMSLNGLLRPFSAVPGSGLLMSSYSAPVTGVTGNVPNQKTLNPWKALNDIEVYAFGTSYQGLHAYRLQLDSGNARPLCLRGPMVLAGWGYDINGECVPGSGDPTSWRADVLRRQDTWKAGPVDLLWDKYRGVWTSHTKVKGTLSTDLPPGSSGVMSVDPLGVNKTIWNYFGTQVNAGTKVIADYIATDNKYYVIAADCS
jgi:hypothetical protein